MTRLSLCCGGPARRDRRPGAERGVGTRGSSPSGRGRAGRARFSPRRVSLRDVGGPGGDDGQRPLLARLRPRRLARPLRRQLVRRARRAAVAAARRLAAERPLQEREGEVRRRQPAVGRESRRPRDGLCRRGSRSGRRLRSLRRRSRSGARSSGTTATAGSARVRPPPGWTLAAGGARRRSGTSTGTAGRISSSAATPT